MRMSVNQEKLYATTDAAVWAAEFMAEFGDRKDDIDEGLMIGWFANAIETAERINGERTRRELEFLTTLADGGGIKVNGVPWREMFEKINALVSDPV